MNSAFRTIGAWAALASSAFAGQPKQKSEPPEKQDALTTLVVPELTRELAQRSVEDLSPKTSDVLGLETAPKSIESGNELKLDTGGAKLSFSASSQVVSQYRTSSGVVLYDGPGLQSSLTTLLSTEQGTFGFTAWNHLSFGNQPGDFTEVDLDVSYSRPLTENLTLNASFNDFLFPVASDHIKDTHELNLGLSLSNVKVPVSANLYVDVDEARYTYLDLGVSKSFALSETVTFEPAAHYFHVIEAGNFFKGEGPFSYTIGGTLNWQPSAGGPTFYGGVRYTDGIYEGPDSSGFAAKDGMYFFAGVKIDF